MTNAAAEIRLRKKMTLAVAKRKSKTREVGEEVMREGGGKERERERERVRERVKRGSDLCRRKRLTHIELKYQSGVFLKQPFVELSCTELKEFE